MDFAAKSVTKPPINPATKPLVSIIENIAAPMRIASSRNAQNRCFVPRIIARPLPGLRQIITKSNIGFKACGRYNRRLNFMSLRERVETLYILQSSTAEGATARNRSGKRTADDKLTLERGLLRFNHSARSTEGAQALR